MNIERIAAFCDGEAGGNPAGVVIADALPEAAEMQAIAAEVGYSETAFAAPLPGGGFRVRYFAPESEVPFCGHATIALGAALARKEGPGRFALTLNDAEIAVEAEGGAVSLVSPPSRSGPSAPGVLAEALALFGLTQADLAEAPAPAIAHAGADHLVLPLASRDRLAAMDYDLAAGAALMRREGWTTISLLWFESPRRVHARNAFASGGVLEDPATGAAAAALGGYLRDAGWPHGGEIEILQGADMGAPSRLRVEIGAQKGESLRVSGAARWIS